MAKPTNHRRSRFQETTISTSANTTCTPSISTCTLAPPPPPPHSENNMDSPFTKFNSALTAGLLNPNTTSPPPEYFNKTRSSPTLFEMMASEPDPNTHFPAPGSAGPTRGGIGVDKVAVAQNRISDLLARRSPGSLFNDQGSSDVRLTLSGKDGVRVCLNVHRQILVGNSRFFAAKLCEKRRGLGVGEGNKGLGGGYDVEISDCDGVEVYVETVMLMYCKDLRRRLMREDVCRVLDILKVSAAIEFDAGVLSCLEFLEAAPWAEDEEQKVASLLSELRLEGVCAVDVLKRVSIDVTSGIEEGNDNDEILLKLLLVVLEGKDEKARREMKGLVSKMLRENSSSIDLRKESLYSACDGCLNLLREIFLRAAGENFQEVAQIARQADNLHWILDIMIDRQIAEDFLNSWASLSELSDAHSRVPAIHRYEISKITARLFVGIGKGQLLASKDARCLLLKNWLVPFYEDFAWMRRGSKGIDRHLVEDGLSNTILTLPLTWQQEIFMSWFDRFLNSGDDCPNIQRGFEVWWRRAFWRRTGEPEPPKQLRITSGTVENS